MEELFATIDAQSRESVEAMFLGGKSKGPFLAAFGADIFFDDQHVHCESANEHVATGHVPNGVTNSKN